jgi:hypothetical protein
MFEQAREDAQALQIHGLACKSRRSAQENKHPVDRWVRRNARGALPRSAHPKESVTVKGLFLAMTFALAYTAAHADMPHDQTYIENEKAYFKTHDEVEQEYFRTMLQCKLDTDLYMAEHPVHAENYLDQMKIDEKTEHRRYALCMNAKGWPSPFTEDVDNPTASLVKEQFRRVMEKWEASGKDVHWLDAYSADYMARIYPNDK